MIAVTGADDGFHQSGLGLRLGHIVKVYFGVYNNLPAASFFVLVFIQALREAARRRRNIGREAQHISKVFLRWVYWR